MLIAVAVFKNVRAENVARAEVIRTIRLVHGSIKAVVVLKSAVDIPVPGNNPSVVKTVMIDGMVIP